MKNMQKNLHNDINLYGYYHIPHIICLADFNTNHPNPNRVDRIASEINEYLKYDRKNNKA